MLAGVSERIGQSEFVYYCILCYQYELRDIEICPISLGKAVIISGTSYLKLGKSPYS